jgi:hypothetical protein
MKGTAAAVNWGTVLGVVAAALIGSLALGVLLFLGTGWLITCLTIRRLHQRVPAILPPGVTVIGVIPAVTPPMTRSQGRASWLFAFPGSLVLPLSLPLYLVMMRRRALRVVAFTSDGQTWVVGRKSWSGRLTGVLYHEPTATWRVDREHWLPRTTLGPEVMSLSRWFVADQLPVHS